ncbi:hypothetical protein DOTSEDRAFT_37143 [Dothistroma septosporum NZE10]|uniref:Uncharacterized protein n=1 Tax=Dothistroma septosporum (strain NZE10 / CBS 128990) TaxID=675120 RepID=N1PKK2_DOTSN|nr:hypothetical protein DOTSEDRAFT_37143 [Dothistroma septosporum NZE10]
MPEEYGTFMFRETCTCDAYLSATSHCRSHGRSAQRSTTVSAAPVSDGMWLSMRMSLAIADWQNVLAQDLSRPNAEGATMSADSKSHKPWAYLISVPVRPPESGSAGCGSVVGQKRDQNLNPSADTPSGAAGCCSADPMKPWRRVGCIRAKRFGRREEIQNLTRIQVRLRVILSDPLWCVWRLLKRRIQQSVPEVPAETQDDPSALSRGLQRERTPTGSQESGQMRR